MRRPQVITVLAVSISFLGVSACTDDGPTPAKVTPTPTPPPVASATDFDPTHFTNPTEVTNP